MPNPFPWPLFLAGEAIGLGGFLHAWRMGRSESPPVRRGTGTWIEATAEIETVRMT
jgi:hypothetical protein